MRTTKYVIKHVASIFSGLHENLTLNMLVLVVVEVTVRCMTINPWIFFKQALQVILLHIIVACNFAPKIGIMTDPNTTVPHP